MQVYLDEKYCCYVQQNEHKTRTPCEVLALTGKCRTYVEGMRYVPQGAVWTRDDGVQFDGAMLTPHQPYDGLLLAQGAYEDALATLRADLQPQIDDMLVALVEV